MSLKKITCIFIIIIISSWFALLFGEYTIRNIYPSEALQTHPDIYEYDSLLGWTFKKNTEFVIPSPDGETVNLSFNQTGIRNSDRTIEGKINILFLGDSTTGAIQVQDDHHFESFIENEFEEINVINAGVNGYNTAQSLMMMKELIEITKPAAIFYLINSNDIIGNLIEFTQIGAYRYQAPYVTYENGKLIYKKVSVDDRALIGSMLINSDLLYCLEYRNKDAIAKIIENSSIFDKAFSRYKDIEYILNQEKVSNKQLEQIKRALRSCLPNLADIQKIVKKRQSAEPSLFSFFAIKNRIKQAIKALIKRESKVFDLQTYYGDVIGCPAASVSNPTKNMRRAWNITDKLIHEMALTAEKKSIHFAVIPHLQPLLLDELYTKTIEERYGDDCNILTIRNFLERVTAKYRIGYVKEVLEVSKNMYQGRGSYHYINFKGQVINGHYTKNGHDVVGIGVVEYLNQKIQNGEVLGIRKASSSNGEIE